MKTGHFNRKSWNICHVYWLLHPVRGFNYKVLTNLGIRGIYVSKVFTGTTISEVIYMGESIVNG